MAVYTISSPLRKLERLRLDSETDDSHDPSLHSFERLDAIFQLSPLEILELQRDQFDYICGVLTAGHPCKNSFYCLLHLIEERMEVPRSLPLSALIRNEIHDKLLFRRKRRLVKLYHVCKAYWNGNQSVFKTPDTCSQTSCVADALDDDTSTKRGSEISHNSATDDAELKQRKFALLKHAFLKKILKPTDANVRERVSYLFYKLSSIESQEVDARARELEVRFNSSE